MPQKATDIVVWGKTTSGKVARMGRRTAAHLDYTIERLKKKYPHAKLHVIQSAYNTGVKASAGTHDKDGCLDLWIEGLGWWEAQRFLRECGWAAWYRFPPAFGHHLHVISLGCTGPMGVFVPGQINDYYRHALGLKGQHNSGADRSWFPKNIKATIFDYKAYQKRLAVAAAKAAAAEKAAKAAKAKAEAAAKAAKAAADKKAAAAAKKAHVDYRLFLVPGNKKQTTMQIRSDMARVNARGGTSAVVVNTERESKTARKAVAEGLGSEFVSYFDNECVMAFGTKWTVGADSCSLVLAKDDPSMAKVSPTRRLNIAFTSHPNLPGVVVDQMGSHLTSEANCIHHNVRARAWREKTWKIQVNDVLDAVERSHKAGHVVILAMDANVGVEFTGRQLFELFKERFGTDAVHIHNGGLDQIIAVGTDKVQVLELGTEILDNNTSDHDSVEVTVRLAMR